MTFKTIQGFFFLVLTFAAASQNSLSGDWVGELDYGEVNCPFRFQMIEEKDGVDMVLINSEERIKHLVERRGDSLFVHLKPFDSFIRAKFSEGKITGEWTKPYREFSCEFAATPTSFGSMNDVRSEAITWSLTLQSGTPDEYPGVAKLSKRGNKVIGTILTETGDYRFFEGVFTEDSISMSSFDGSHGFLFIGSKSGHEWSGTIYYERGFTEPWSAKVDQEASLADPFDLITVELGTQSIYYDLLGAGSGRNSIDVEKYKGKVLLVQVFGTWCPNSWDQTQFLLDWYGDRPKDVEVLAVTFEPNYSQEYGLRRINEYSEHLSIPYDMVLGGALSKTQAAMAFPFMRKLVAFPTLVFVDKQGFVRYVHSYFNGPATGSLYDEFKGEFKQKIDELVSE